MEKITQYLIQSTVHGSEVRAWEEDIMLPTYEKKRHFVYYNQVVKPALVGLTGPWISGGIEFNWPQHHRPSTFLPTDFLIEENADGSKTIWCNEVERMFRTKGMQGFTLYPGKAYIEIKVKIYNRTSFPQTFLWWANPAVVVNDHYHSRCSITASAMSLLSLLLQGFIISRIILLVWISLNIRIFRFLHHIWLSSLNMILWVAMKKMFVGDFCTWPIIMFLRERNNGHGGMVISVRRGIAI